MSENMNDTISFWSKKIIFCFRNMYLIAEIHVSSSSIHFLETRKLFLVLNFLDHLCSYRHFHDWMLIFSPHTMGYMISTRFLTEKPLLFVKWRLFRGVITISYLIRGKKEDRVYSEKVAKKYLFTKIVIAIFLTR